MNWKFLWFLPPLEVLEAFPRRGHRGDDLHPLGHQLIDKVGPDEAGSTGDEDRHQPLLTSKSFDRRQACPSGRPSHRSRDHGFHRVRIDARDVSPEALTTENVEDLVKPLVAHATLDLTDVIVEDDIAGGVSCLVAVVLATTLAIRCCFSRALPGAIRIPALPIFSSS
jgi:hypothetical protein